MQGSKSNFFAKSNKRSRYSEDDYTGGSNSKRHVDGNKVARQKANRQRQRNQDNDYGY